MEITEQTYQTVAAGVDPVDPEEAAANPSFRAAVDGAYIAALNAAYWKLREHASAYRNTKGFRSAMASWEADRHNDRRYASAVLHEWFARGIEAAARDIAELLGVPEHEIEPEPAPATVPTP